ncbi:growth/differentiation factor 10 [Paramormyrops kingsleyae]|uniref:Growth/differentiation factor 10 n=1 Tax=Paramormyrops kingsleyae TaxID=1676925 RepID=A0A3B3T938_9TELE
MIRGFIKRLTVVLGMAGIILVHLLLCLINSYLGSYASDHQDARRSSQGEMVESSPGKIASSTSRDMVSVHMFKLYDKYNRERNSPGDGNTVRSFKATPEIVEERVLYQFNLTSIQESEVVLSSTFHFFFSKRLRQRAWPCKRSRGPYCGPQHLLPPVQLLLWRVLQDGSPGALLTNFTLVLQRRGAWHVKDISHVLKGVRNTNERFIMAEFDLGEHYRAYGELASSTNLPYILVYANDLSISEPNSVAKTLQRYDPFFTAGEPTEPPNSFPDARVKRDTYFQDPIDNNELPEVEYEAPMKLDLWEGSYLTLKPKPTKKTGKRKSQEESNGRSQSLVLSFDEKTMKKARRRQWDEPRSCFRRYLKVDFADIGWSEWILSPKSFDAYYCSGTCQFPMSKVVRPSNHATIQSIVKAVGITSGIPEPCCVPDKMNPLSVLFLDEGHNVVLKVYPGMSVETCACR